MAIKTDHPLRRNLLLFIVIYLPPICFLLALFLVSKIDSTSYKYYTQDMMVLGKLSRLASIVSNLGIILWAATAAICGFCALIVRERFRQEFLFFLCASALSLWLWLDDMLLIHEFAGTYLGISEFASFIVYGLLLMSFIYYFRRLIAQTPISFLGLFVIFTCLSILLDLLPVYFPISISDRTFDFEEGSKFLAIVSWFAYFVYTGFLILRSRLTADQAT